MYNSFSDSPTHNDEFNIENDIQGLTKFISNCETPLTIAIQGDWGTGKTSIMYQIEKNLKDTSGRIKTIFFNTWQYSQFKMENDLAVSLITDLINQLEVSESKKRKFLETASGLLFNGLRYINLDLGPFNGEKISEKLQEIAETFKDKTNDIKFLKNPIQICYY
ncbi:P-loop NTPase fold protein [Streptococcus pluranimalium]|uniref:P-loop NTPase fold protein n=1 Tax=Streptococcus pluranimalium TaxID=82348 RepID=UPI0039FD8AB9